MGDRREAEAGVGGRLLGRLPTEDIGGDAGCAGYECVYQPTSCLPTSKGAQRAKPRLHYGKPYLP